MATSDTPTETGPTETGPTETGRDERTPAGIDPADVDALRGALGRFATGVTVIAARGPDGAPAGFTANSFNSVSLDPPLILWSLARSSPRLPVYREAEHYAVNILAAGQADLAARFAKRGHDRFAGVDWREGLGGAPVLGGALAVFECAHEAVYPAGDHELFIGRVLRCTMAEGAPLTFFAGRFGSLQDMEAPGEAPGEASGEASGEAAVDPEARAAPKPPATPEELSAALGAATARAAGGAARNGAFARLSPTEARELRRLLARIG